MMHRMERGGYRNHHLLRFSVFPVEYPDFVKIEHSLGSTILYRLVHAARSLIMENFWNLQPQALPVANFSPRPIPRNEGK
jgi:hypothetical protein